MSPVIPPPVPAPIIHPNLEDLNEVMKPDMDALLNDAAFATAYQAVDIDRVAQAFIEFTDSIKGYSLFHTRERRLWAVKLGKGSIPAALETKFKEDVPANKAQYITAFSKMQEIVSHLEKAGFDPVLKQHMNRFTRVLTDKAHPLTTVASAYFHRIGCSEPMLDEFRSKFASVGYEFVGPVVSDLAELRLLTSKAMAAQVQILDETEKNGFAYLRGHCGPPAWAVVASEILGAFGITISAWVIVAIVVTLLATLVAICRAAPPGSWAKKKCQKLHVLLPVFSF
jgi:hypothetical protein